MYIKRNILILYKIKSLGDFLIKSMKNWQKIGFVFTGIFGVLLHFLYDWTNKSVFIAPFSAVNESTWEHMKLLFYPMVVFSFIEYKLVGKSYKNYWCVKVIGLLVGLMVIPLIYYTYTGALGVSADWFNITIFFIAAAVAYFVETRLFVNGFPPFCSDKIAFSVLILIFLLFVIFTFVQPKIPLFIDPVTKAYAGDI